MRWLELIHVLSIRFRVEMGQKTSRETKKATSSSFFILVLEPAYSYMARESHQYLESTFTFCGTH